jgi:hypothetical protein
VAAPRVKSSTVEKAELPVALEPRAAAAMTIVQISDYRSPRKSLSQKKQRRRDRHHECDRTLSSGLRIACGMILSWIVVFIAVGGVGHYLQ